MRNKSLTSLLILAIIVGAFFLRTYEIQLRPLHHDEGVNFHFLKEISAKGYYEYSHLNYHGPLYFYISKLFLNIFGENELGLRLGSIVSGMVLVVLPFFIMESLGVGFALLTAAFLALSPSLVFHSRYAIHEMLFLLLSIWFAVANFKWFASGAKSDLYQIFISLALLIATKETFVITGAATLLGLLCAFGFRHVGSQVLSNWARYGGPFVAFTVLLLGSFSGGFQWFAGIHEMFLAVAQWISRGTGDVGHFKPFLFYTRVIQRTEPHLLIFYAISLGAFLALILPKLKEAKVAQIFWQDQFLRFLIGLSVGFWLIYGLVSYKTVWLIISQTGALILLMTRVFYLTFVHSSRLSKALIGIVIALSLGVSASNSIYFNFTEPYSQSHPYCYVHTSEGMLRLVSDIRKYQQTHLNSKILVGVNSYWPLPFYLKDYASLVAYQNIQGPQVYANTTDIIIADSTSTSQMPGWVRKYYRLSGVQESHTYFRIK